MIGDDELMVEKAYLHTFEKYALAWSFFSGNLTPVVTNQLPH